MSSERRYSEREVASIFERAAEAQTLGGPDDGEGLTLSELQAIGAEVGLSPAHIAQAAAALDPEAPPPSRRTLGIPTSAAHSVLLPAPLTDADWERLIVQFRDTFDATGKTTREGSLRTWSNGNLRISTEPTDTGGHRIRFATRNASFRSGLIGGGVNMAAGLVLFVLFSGFITNEPFVPVFALQFLVGAVVAGASAAQAAPWARKRAEQFEHLGRQALALAAASGAVPEQRVSAQPALSLDGLPEIPAPGPAASTSTLGRRRERG